MFYFEEPVHISELGQQSLATLDCPSTETEVPIDGLLEAMEEVEQCKTNCSATPGQCFDYQSFQYAFNSTY